MINIEDTSLTGSEGRYAVTSKNVYENTLNYYSVRLPLGTSQEEREARLHEINVLRDLYHGKDDHTIEVQIIQDPEGKDGDELAYFTAAHMTMGMRQWCRDGTRLIDAREVKR